MVWQPHDTPHHLGGMPGFHVFMCPEPDRGGRGQARATMRGCSISGCVHCVFRAFSGSLECVQRRQYKFTRGTGLLPSRYTLC